MNNIYKNKYFKYKKKYLELKKQNLSLNQFGSGNNNYKKKFDNIKIYNEQGELVDLKKRERFEQELVKQHILPTDSVLELGARYGSVSVIVNKIIKNKSNQVVVEPDSRVWEALELNKKNNNCEFKIFKGLVGKNKYSLTNKEKFDGYAATMVLDPESDIESITLENLLSKFKINPNVLIVDCEGCFELFVDENIDFIKNLRMIMYEADYPNKSDYIKIENILIENGYKIIDVWSNQYVWKKLRNGEKINLDKQLEYLERHRVKLLKEKERIIKNESES
jgi:FkbM family methyltransferase